MCKSSRKCRRKSWKAPGSATSNALFTFSFLSRRSLYAPVLPELPLQLRAAKNSEFWQMSGCCRPWRWMGWAWHLREVWDGSLPHSNHSTPERGTKSPSGGSAWRLLAMWRWQSAAMSKTKIRGCFFSTHIVIIHIHLKYRYSSSVNIWFKSHTWNVSLSMPSQFFTATNSAFPRLPTVRIIQSVEVVIFLLSEPQKKILRPECLGTRTVRQRS